MNFKCKNCGDVMNIARIYHKKNSKKNIVVCGQCFKKLKES